MILKASETLLDAALSANSENINYPLVNLFDSRLSRYFRTDSGTTTATIVFDAGAAITVNSIDIAGHNISSGVSTLKFQGNATDAWGGPSVDETLTWVAGVINKDFTGGSYRYWRLHIIDAGNSDTFIKLGRVYGSNAYSTPIISYEVSHSYQSGTKKTRTPVGVTYGDIRIKENLVSVKWPKILTVTDKPALITAFDSVDISKPFFVTFDDSVSGLGTLYITIDGNGLHFVYYRNAVYSKAAISFIEEIG